MILNKKNQKIYDEVNKLFLTDRRGICFLEASLQHLTEKFEAPVPPTKEQKENRVFILLSIFCSAVSDGLIKLKLDDRKNLHKK